MNDAHLTDLALVVLAASRKPHPHLDVCAYCRQQYEALIAMEDFESETDAAGDRKGNRAHSFAGSYRLAAQSADGDEVGLILRQTWYLDNGHVLLRVFEEEGIRLIGYVICAPDRLPKLRVRFSGVDKIFAPGIDGSFIIGDASLVVEAMSVTLEERE